MALIVLPWPPRELHPNSRVDRRHATRHRRGYREAGFYAVKAAQVRVAPNAELSITFCPPDHRRRDLDGMLAAIKAGLDGIALAAGVDDYGWRLRIARADPVPGGEVRIEVNNEADAWRRIGEVARGMVRGEIA